MPSVFPGALDSFTDPLTTSPLNSPSHAGQHQDINDAVEKVEQYMGLVKVIPTGATNGTVGATGTVTVGNAVTSVTVSGAFSSLYDNYRIIYTGGTSSANGAISFALNGSPTGWYGNLIYANFANGAPASAGYNNTNNLTHAGSISGLIPQLNLEVRNPFLAQGTFASGSFVDGTNAGHVMGVNGNLASYTGFILAHMSGGNLTGGQIRIYGYRN